MTPIQSACIEHKTKSSCDGLTASVSYSFPESFLGFEGHFKSRPILPAVVQCCLGVQVCEYMIGRKLVIKGISKAKYKQQIGPNSPITVTSQTKKNTALEDLCFSISIHNDTGLVASFHLHLSEVV